MNIWGDRQIKVRKRHRCDWCGQCIDKDELCESWKVADHSTVRTCRMHGECVNAAAASDLDDGLFDVYMQQRGEPIY